MGVFEIDLHEINALLRSRGRDTAPGSNLRQIRRVRKDPVTGALELVLRWRHNPDLHFSPFGGFAEPEKYLEKPPNELRVCLIRGKGLIPRERSKRKDDPGSARLGACFTYAGSDLRVASESREATLSPTWKQELILPIEEFQKSVEGPHLSVKLESVVSGSSMGTFEVPLRPTMHSLRRTTWCAVEPDVMARKSKGAWRSRCIGVITRSAYGRTRRRSTVPTKVRNELLLAVVRARDLAPKKGGLFSGGLPSPSVRLPSAGHRRRGDHNQEEEHAAPRLLKKNLNRSTRLG